MRHVVVERVSTGLSALLVVASALAAWRADVVRTRGPVDEPGPRSEEAGRVAGAAAFARHCVGCHELAQLAERSRNASDRAAAAAALVEFLRDHGAATELQDRAIVRWLLALEAADPARAPHSR